MFIGPDKGMSLFCKINEWASDDSKILDKTPVVRTEGLATPRKGVRKVKFDLDSKIFDLDSKILA